MKEKINYQDWPAMVKITTALSHKNFHITNHKIPLVLGYLLLIIGLLDLTFRVVQDGIYDYNIFVKPLGYALIGLLNVGGSSTLKWISANSSWEERFQNTSSISHKLINILSMAILFLSLYLIFVFD